MLPLVPSYLGFVTGMSLEDQGKAKAYIAANWDSVVGANVSK